MSGSCFPLDMLPDVVLYSLLHYLPIGEDYVFFKVLLTQCVLF